MVDGLVSVIIPLFNEEKYLKRCIDSIIKQDYSSDYLEVLFIDGNSTDKTVEIIKSYHIDYFKIINNPKRIVTYALNIGIQESKGQFIVRMDAHAEYNNNYISLCINTLKTIEADNVGGVAITKGNGMIGMANADILSSKFGVGNSRFRTSSISGYVDTVPFGTFRRELFNEIGLFDVALSRSEDNDINSRIRAKGGKVYLNADINFIYYCRETLRGLLNQALKNGNALFLTLRKNPKAMSLRHFIPFLFVLSLIFLPIFSVFYNLGWFILFAELMFYFILDVIFSMKGQSKKVFYKTFAFLMYHIAYGIGSLIGLIGIKLY